MTDLPRETRTIEWPAELTDDLAEILGRPNFTCGHIAHAYRDGGGFEIPPKAEYEQAFVIHRFVQLWSEHGAAWKNIANAEIGRMVELAKKAKQS